MINKLQDVEKGFIHSLKETKICFRLEDQLSSKNMIGLQEIGFTAICPKSHEEVEVIVGLYLKHQKPLYPYSRGCNWGLGSK